MSEIISYEELRKIQTLERENKELQQLDESFFKKVKEYISLKQKLLEENKNKDNAFSKMSVEQIEKELENINKILHDISYRRTRKIVLQALTNINSRIHDTGKMLQFEEKLYQDCIKLFNENVAQFMALFKEQKNEQFKKVKFLEPVPQFVWSDGKTYGPYNKDDIADLPNVVGEILINERKAILLVKEGCEA